MKLVNKSKQEIGSEIDAMKAAAPLQIQMYAEIAKLEKKYYDELLKSGFKKDEALHIVAVQGVLANGQPSKN